eukprot:m51a1_g12209 putative adp-ribosylation factor (356) ;mRNA; f:149-1873
MESKPAAESAPPATSPQSETPPAIAGASEDAATPLDLLQKIGTAAADKVAPMLTTAGQTLGAATSRLVPTLNAAGKSIEDAANAAGKVVEDAAGKAAQITAPAFKAVEDAAGKAVEYTAPALGAVKTKTVEAVDAVKKMVPPGVSSAASTAAAQAQSAASSIGSWFTRAAASLVGAAEPSIVLVLGLEGAGKTAFIDHVREMARNAGATGVPADDPTGFESAEINGLLLRAFRATGPSLPSWLPTAALESSRTRAVVFLIDASDRDHLPEARDALREIMAVLCAPGAALAKGGALLVFANKGDKEGAANAEELAGALALRSLPSPYVVWNVQPGAATVGDGVSEGLAWVSEVING